MEPIGNSVGGNYHTVFDCSLSSRIRYVPRTAVSMCSVAELTEVWPNSSQLQPKSRFHPSQPYRTR